MNSHTLTLIGLLLLTVVCLLSKKTATKKTIRKPRTYERDIFGQFTKKRNVVWVSQLGEIK